jgi:hypothetical protein
MLHERRIEAACKVSEFQFTNSEAIWPRVPVGVRRGAVPRPGDVNEKTMGDGMATAENSHSRQKILG